MKSPDLTRRRLLTIAAAAGCSALLSGPATQAAVEWRGPVLGGEGRLLFDGLDSQKAHRAISAVIAEVDRLESVFSLFRRGSELSRLNREGVIANPSHDFRMVLSAAMETWQRSEGAFNPAIQPLWRYLADHFAGPSRAREPDRSGLAAVRAKCDPSRISVSGDAVRIVPGMALTFNGIAQGYIADRAAELLEQHGLTRTLVQLGETRGVPGLAWPASAQGTGRRFTIDGTAIATSAGAATPFTADGRWHHLIDPATGRAGHVFSTVTVSHRSAMVADAVSTALSVGDQDAAERTVARFAGLGAVVQLNDGAIVELGQV